MRSLTPMRLTRIGHGSFGPEDLRGKWNLVSVTAGPCEIACRERLDRMLQIHLALEKDHLRLQRLAFLGATFEVQNRIEGLFIVDPQSNLILRYENRADPEGVLKDLKRLLKYSWIG